MSREEQGFALLLAKTLLYQSVGVLGLPPIAKGCVFPFRLRVCPEQICWNGLVLLYMEDFYGPG